MTGRTHDLAAITALGVVVLAVSPTPHMNLATALVAIFANLVGGIAPDIDQPTAPFWRNLPIGGVIGRIIDKMLGGHRFITHSVLGVALLTGIIYLILNFLHPVTPSLDITLILWAFVIGAASHLLADMLTKEGVPLLLPIPYKFGFPPIRSLRITTGKLIESGIIFPGLIVFDFYWAYTHYHQILAIAHSLM